MRETILLAHVDRLASRISAGHPSFPHCQRQKRDLARIIRALWDSDHNWNSRMAVDDALLFAMMRHTGAACTVCSAVSKRGELYWGVVLCPRCHRSYDAWWSRTRTYGAESMAGWLAFVVLRRPKYLERSNDHRVLPYREPVAHRVKPVERPNVHRRLREIQLLHRWDSRRRKRRHRSRAIARCLVARAGLEANAATMVLRLHDRATTTGIYANRIDQIWREDGLSHELLLDLADADVIKPGCGWNGDPWPRFCAKRLRAAARRPGAAGRPG